MTVLELMDSVRAGTYRSDRFPAVPFTTVEQAMQHAQDVLSAVNPADDWQGIVTPSCDDHSRTLVVPRRVGIGLRIGCEANLCFTCGPDGGHYHPGEGETMDSVAAVAERLSSTEETN